MQANGELEFPKLLDRLIHLHLAAIDGEVLLSQCIGHVLRSNRPEHLIVLAGLLGDGDGQSGQQLRQVLGSALLLGFPAQVRVALLLNDLARPGCGSPIVRYLRAV